MPHNPHDNDNVHDLELSELSKNLLGDEDYDDFQYYNKSEEDPEFSGDDEPDFAEVADTINRGNKQLREAQFLRSLVSDEPARAVREHKREKPVKKLIKPAEPMQMHSVFAPKPQGPHNIRHLKKELNDITKQLQEERLHKAQNDTKSHIIALEKQLLELAALNNKMESSNDRTRRFPPTHDATDLESAFASNKKQLIDYLLLHMGGIDTHHADYPSFSNIELNVLINYVQSTVKIYLRSQQHHPDKHIKHTEVQAKFVHDVSLYLEIMELQKGIREFYRLWDSISQHGKEPLQSYVPDMSSYTKQRAIKHVLREIGGFDDPHSDLFKKLLKIRLKDLIATVQQINDYLRESAGKPDRHLELLDVQNKFRHDLIQNITRKSTPRAKPQLHIDIDMDENDNIQPMTVLQRLSHTISEILKKTSCMFCLFIAALQFVFCENTN